MTPAPSGVPLQYQQSLETLTSELLMLRHVAAWCPVCRGRRTYSTASNAQEALLSGDALTFPCLKCESIWKYIDRVSTLVNIVREAAREQQTPALRQEHSYTPGNLEIDHRRGVIYFHADIPEEEAARMQAVTRLRICCLPAPIPPTGLLDVTHMVGASWKEAK